jgi:putative DNA primase/helicase
MTRIAPLQVIVTDYIANVDMFYKNNPFFYDRAGIFWFWNMKRKCYEIVDEIDLLNSIDEGLSFYGAIQTGKARANYINAFKSVGRKHIPKEPSKYLVQFKDKIFNIKTKDISEPDPNIFFVNPIPHGIGETSETPVMDKIFTEWLGESYKKTLYEVLAYFCLPDYPIHTIFCLIGAGRNGKSTFLSLVNKFIGNDNICSTELDNLLDSRFESAKLYKKLVCTVGETNFGTINKTSLIKKLTGQDLIGAEFKNKKPFDFINYSKLVIASNSLPSSNDTSEGFYRRWVITHWDSEFKEGGDILNIIPEEEYSNLVKKITEILPDIIERGYFTNQGTIEERKQRYILASNPITRFLELCCNRSDNALYVKYAELYSAYFQFLILNKRRTIKMKEFKQLLAEEGVEIERTTRGNETGYYAIGVGIYQNWKELMQKMTKMQVVSTQSHEKDKQSGNVVINVMNVIKNEVNNDLFINKLQKYVENEQPYQKVLEFVKIENSMDDQKSEDFINHAKSEGLIAEFRPGFLKVVQ